MLYSTSKGLVHRSIKEPILCSPNLVDVHIVSNLALWRM